MSKPQQLTYADIIDTPKYAKKAGINPVMDSKGQFYYFVDMTQDQFDGMMRDDDFVNAVLCSGFQDDGVFDGAIKTVDGIAVRVSPLLDNNTVASTQTLL